MSNKLKILVLCVFLTGSLSSLRTVSAAPGDLDLSFSQDGKLYDFLLHGQEDFIHGSALQSDGKIVAAGHFIFGQVRSCAISRYNTDGTLDATFDGDGTTVFPSGRECVLNAVAIQTDGKIVAAGRIGDVRPDFVVFRYNTDGSPDNSFNLDGMAITSFGNNNDAAHALVIQPDGKIVAAGIGSGIGQNDISLARYNTDGSLDTSFDFDGKVSTVSGSQVYGVALQADGKIVTAGVAGFATSFARYNTNGSLDTSFDGDGTLTIEVGFGARAHAVAIQTDGKIVAAGSCTVFTGPGIPAPQNLEFAAIRLNTDGSLDTSFDFDGRVIINISAFDDIVNAIALRPDGKIVLAGSTGAANSSHKNFALARLNIDGSLDPSFNSTGKIITPFTTGENAAHAVNIQSDGKIVAAGYASFCCSAGKDFAVLRFNIDGSIDSSFSSDGRTNHDVGFRPSFGRAIAMGPNGKFVVAGFTHGSGDLDFAVIRYNADGSADTSFGADGKVVTPVRPGDDDARAVAIQVDGKVVVVGTASHPFNQPNTTVDGAVLRYNIDGSLDATFDLDGKALIDSGGYDLGNAVAIQPDGKIVVAGDTQASGEGFRIMLTRLNPDGSLDTSFDTDGMVIVSDLTSGRAFAVAIQADGKIVAAGEAYNGSNFDVAVVRFNADGSLDTSFDFDGKVLTPVITNDGANAVAIQPDGKIVVAGFGSIGSMTANEFALVRYNPDGSLDSSFNFDGKLTTGILPGMDTANAIAIQANGKIIAAGTSDTNGSTSEINNTSDFAMVRFNPDGLFDTTFGVGGKLTFDFWGTSDDRLHGMVLDPNGRAVVVGQASQNVAIARVLGDFIQSARAPFDFDGDGKTDIGIFRPGAAEWWIQKSGDGNVRAAQFGATTDRIAPADYTGDGKSDIAVWRPSSGEWYVLRSEDFSFFAFPFGTDGDIPAPADYDVDGKADAAVFRPSSATWFIRRSSDGGTTTKSFGANGDVPVPADYDGDGRADIAIFRPSNGQWWLDRSAAGVIAMTFGDAAVKPVQGDYTGDGKADVAFWRPATGEWFVLRSENFSFYSFPFGTTEDIPAPGDYDGDARYDATVFRPSSGTWYSQRTTAGTLIQQFGLSGDRPVASAFVP